MNNACVQDDQWLVCAGRLAQGGSETMTELMIEIMNKLTDDCIDKTNNTSTKLNKTCAQFKIEKDIFHKTSSLNKDCSKEKACCPGCKITLS